jgi:hypothetical protein
MPATGEKAPHLLKPGDRFEHRGTAVRVISGPAEAKDQFGRIMNRLQGQREDTGATGAIDFGPGAKPVKMLPAAEAVPQLEKVEPSALKVGDHFIRNGARHEVIGPPRAGRKAGEKVTMVQVRRQDGKTGPVTLTGPVERIEEARGDEPFQGVAGGTAARMEAARERAGLPGRTPGGTSVDTSRAARETGGVTKPQTAYQVGQRVEAQAYSFDKPGTPREWYPGTIERAEPIGDPSKGRFDLMVRLDDGRQVPHTVGPRGGGKAVRPLDGGGAGGVTTLPKSATESHDEMIARLQREADAKTAAARAEHLATREGVPPTDGRPDVSAITGMQGRNRDYELGLSRGRKAHQSPDIVRAGNGYMDDQPASAEIMNPVDGTGDYRYRIYNDSTGATLEEGTAPDLAGVKAKVDRIWSSQRGGGMARSASAGPVHFEARETERPKDRNRGDIGKGPFYDYTVVQVNPDGSEKVKIKTSSMDRAEEHAAGLNAKETANAPAAKPTGRLQTFAQRMAGDLSEADLREARRAADERAAQARAEQAARSAAAAEAAANDTRTEREKVEETLANLKTIRDIGMRQGRVDQGREAKIRQLEARREEFRTEDRKAKIKELGVQKGDTVKTSLGEFEVAGTNKEGYLRVLRPDGKRGSVDPKNVESVTKAEAPSAPTMEVPSFKLPGTARREATADKVQAAQDALSAATTRGEGDAAVADMTTTELRHLAEKLNVHIGGMSKFDAQQRIVERAVGSRLNSAAIRDRGNFAGAAYLGNGDTPRTAGTGAAPAADLLAGQTPDAFIGRVGIYNAVNRGPVTPPSVKRAEQALRRAPEGPERQKAAADYLAAVEANKQHVIDDRVAESARAIGVEVREGAMRYPAVRAAFDDYLAKRRAAATVEAGNMELVHAPTVANGEKWKREKDRANKAANDAWQTVRDTLDRERSAETRSRVGGGPMESRPATALADRLGKPIQYGDALSMLKAQQRPTDPDLSPTVRRLKEEEIAAELHFRALSMVDESHAKRMDTSARLGVGTYELNNATPEQRDALKAAIEDSRAVRASLAVEQAEAQRRFDAALSATNAASEAEQAARRTELRDALAHAKASVPEPPDIKQVEKDAVREARAQYGLPTEANARKMSNSGPRMGARSPEAVAGGAAESLLFKVKERARERANAEHVDAQVRALRQYLDRNPQLSADTRAEILHRIDLGTPSTPNGDPDREFNETVQRWLDARPASMVPASVGRTPGGRAAAAPVNHADVATRLKAAATRTEAEAMVANLKRSDLDKIYEELRRDQPATPFNQGPLRGGTLAEARTNLVELAVGRNLDARAIERAGRTPGGKA